MNIGESNMETQHSGSVKEIHVIDDSTLEFEFTDRISVFDKLIPSTIPGKGESLCKEGKFWFEKTASLGVKTHFIGLSAPNRMRVRRVNIIRDYDAISSSTTNYLIPLEFIARHYVAGSLFDRIQKGKVAAEDAGFEPGHKVRYGEKLPRPYVETSTKLEKIDRLLDIDEALSISGLSQEEYDNIVTIILKIDAAIEEEVSKRGLIHVDGKKEFAFDENREIMIIDVFGTADEDRYWDKDAWENGECVELSKEFVRKHYEQTGYKQELYKARDEKRDEPPIPPLPEDLVQDASKLYADMLYKLTGGV